METNPARDYEVAGSIPALTRWVKELALPMSCGVGRRCGSYPALLWLWRRPSAVALIGPLAWEPPYAAGAKKQKTKKLKTSYSTDLYLLQIENFFFY